jgi:hypothetical protein
MATVPGNSRPAMDVKQETPSRKLSRPGGEGVIDSLPHLFGPVIVIAVVCLGFVAAVYFVWQLPHHPIDELDWAKVKTDLTDARLFDTFKPLFDHQLKGYKELAGKLDTYLGLQALLIATSILVIIRRSDSLNLFGNSIPLSWLHFFIPILLVYLWLASGFTIHEMVSGRMRGVEIGNLFGGEEFKKVFRDGSWIDGWFVSFVDIDKVNYSGIHRHSPSAAATTELLLVVTLGTLFSAAHASALALMSIGCRRYFSITENRRLFWYYALPIMPLTFLLVSHLLFAYGGSNRNVCQLYILVALFPFMGFLLWLSAKIDLTTSPEALQCLRRVRELTVSGSSERLPPRFESETIGDGVEKPERPHET